MNYLLNKDLSLKAKGLLSLLITLKESNIKISQSSILRFCTDGDCSLQSSINELKKRGYLSIKPVSSTNGQLKGFNWYVYEDNYKES
jgi:hypothetical protein